jgi:hypothetical protein
MDVQNLDHREVAMLTIAVVLFAIAAVGGLAMAVMHFRGQTPPKPVLAGVHGLFAASGLVVLLLAVLPAGASGGPGLALGLFLLAAIGGFALLSFHLRKRALPSALLVAHALLAVVACFIFLWALFAPAA